MDTIRVLRVIEYTGPRKDAIERSIQTKEFDTPNGTVVIRAATIGTYPEVLK